MIKARSLHNDDVRTAAARFARHLQARADRYFPDVAADRCHVRLVWQSVRLNSQLYEFEVTGCSASHRVMVKVPFAPKHVAADRRNGGVPVADRPRLFPKTDPYAKGLYEYRALDALDVHFRSLDDRRFGTIRVFDLLPEPYTVVIEKGTAPSFLRLVRKAHGLCGRRQRGLLRDGFRHAGAWLREMHHLAPLEHTEPRNTRRDDYLTANDSFFAFLNRFGASGAFLERFQRRLHEAAVALLPENLPLGTCHGDYAPRNLLLDRAGQVTVFDTTARWRAPIYEDVAHFLASFKISLSQSLSGGLLPDREETAACEEAFLQAYFDEEQVPRGIVRLFQCQLLLERWAALVFRGREARGIRGAAKRCRATLFEMLVKRHLRAALDEAERDVSPTLTTPTTDLLTQQTLTHPLS